MNFKIKNRIIYENERIKEIILKIIRLLNLKNKIK